MAFCALQFIAAALLLPAVRSLFSVPIKSECMNSASECSTGGVGQYPSCSNCAQFIKCSGSTGSTFTCPFTLNYDVNFGVCQYPSLATCGTVTGSSATGTITPAVTVDNGLDLFATCLTAVAECSGLGIGQYPQCEDCTMFIKCYGPSGNLFTCPSALNYDVDLGVCQIADVAVCGTSTSPTSPTSPTSLTSPTSPTSPTSLTSPTSPTSPTIANCIGMCDVDVGFFPSCIACDYFWTCFPTDKFITQCPAGLFFDDDLDRCTSVSATCP